MGERVLDLIGDYIRLAAQRGKFQTALQEALRPGPPPQMAACIREQLADIDRQRLVWRAVRWPPLDGGEHAG